MMRLFDLPPPLSSPPPSFLTGTQMEDWYRVQRKDLENLGLWTMFSHSPSLYHTLKRAYPEFAWQRDRFVKSPRVPVKRSARGYWRDSTHLVAKLKELEQELGIGKVRNIRSHGMRSCEIFPAFRLVFSDSQAGRKGWRRTSILASTAFLVRGPQERVSRLPMEAGIVWEGHPNSRM